MELDCLVSISSMPIRVSATYDELRCTVSSTVVLLGSCLTALGFLRVLGVQKG